MCGLVRLNNENATTNAAAIAKRHLSEHLARKIRIAIGNIKITKCAFQVSGESRTAQQKKGAMPASSQSARTADKIDRAINTIERISVVLSNGLLEPFESPVDTSAPLIDLSIAPRND